MIQRLPKFLHGLLMMRATLHIGAHIGAHIGVHIGVVWLNVSAMCICPFLVDRCCDSSVLDSD